MSIKKLVMPYFNRRNFLLAGAAAAFSAGAAAIVDVYWRWKGPPPATAEQPKLAGLTSGRPTTYTSIVSVPLPSDAEIRKVMGSAYQPDKTMNFAKMFSGAGDLYPAATMLDKAVFTAEGVDPKARQMIILRCAKVLNVPYEWQANVILGKNNGLTEKEIDAAASDGPVEGVSPEYVLLCRATDELSLSATLTDQTLTELLRKYGDTLCRKYVVVISFFNFLSRVLNACRVPLEATDKIGNKASPFQE